jgi:hypothetical protein
MTTAKQAGQGATGKASDDVRETTDIHEEQIRDARGHADTVERTVHHHEVYGDPQGRFKRAVSRMGAMWVGAAAMAVGVAAGVGGTVLVQKRMNRTAVGSTHDVPQITE